MSGAQGDGMSALHHAAERGDAEMTEMLVYAGASWVLWLLIALSVLSVGVMLDRARVFWAQRDDVASQ